MRPRQEADRIHARDARGVDFSVVGAAGAGVTSQTSVVSQAHVVCRTCVGCRSRAPAAELIRFVAAGSGDDLRLQPDPGRRLPGRGAHLHPDPACFALAERRRAFGRALRFIGVADTGLLAEHIRMVSVAMRNDR